MFSSYFSTPLIKPFKIEQSAHYGRVFAFLFQFNKITYLYFLLQNITAWQIQNVAEYTNNPANTMFHFIKLESNNNPEQRTMF